MKGVSGGGGWREKERERERSSNSILCLDGEISWRTQRVRYIILWPRPEGEEGKHRTRRVAIDFSEMTGRLRRKQKPSLRFVLAARNA